MSFTHGHALMIGVGTYQHSSGMDVPITAADAHAVATVLRDPQYGGYPATQVTQLSNADASRAGILAALTALAARTTPEDTVLLFYSGHGAYSADGVYQLTTHDTRWVQGNVVAGTGISQGELIEQLRAIPAKRLSLLINACHAGELSPVLGDSDQLFTGQPFPQQTADAVLSTGSGRIIITACREHQYSYVGGGQTTIFTQVLVEGLRGQGLSGRAGYISAFDLYTHLYFAVGEAVEQRIAADLRKRYSDTQEPELTVLKGVGPFALALYRGATTLGDFPTDHLPPAGTALRTVKPERSQWAFEQQLISGTGAVGIGGSAINSPITTGSNSPIITGDNNTVNQAGKNLYQNSTHVQSSGSGFVFNGPITAGKMNAGGTEYIGHEQIAMPGGTVSGGSEGGMLVHLVPDIQRIPHGSADQRQQIMSMVVHLGLALAALPADQRQDVEAVAEVVADLIAKAGKPQVNPRSLALAANNLVEAASALEDHNYLVAVYAGQVSQAVRALGAG